MIATEMLAGILHFALRLEIADIFVIHTSDRECADRLEREMYAMESLGARLKE